METIEKIAGVTVTLIAEDYCPAHFKQEFKSIPDAVEYMKRNDVIYKPIRMGEKMVTLKLEKTVEANDNWYENEMRITPRHMNPQPKLPTDMFK